MDLTSVIYVIFEWVLAYDFILFFVWLIIVSRAWGSYSAARESGKISDIYLVLMALFISRFYAVFMGMKARSLRELGERDLYIEFMGSVWWDTRLVPEILVYTIIAVLLTRRYVLAYLYKDPRYKAANGRRV